MDDNRNDALPVTSEVGSEGGSFADPTAQVATSEGDIRRHSGRGGASSSATQATRAGDIQPTAPAADGIVRYPTEPPHPPAATEGRRMGGVDWKTGLAGAAAGAAVALAVSSLRARSREQPQTAAPDCETVVVAVTAAIED
jgi:hypothetical protein